MPFCSILECKNDSRNKNITHGGISYHRFPKNPFQKEKWIDATGRKNWMPAKTSTICSAHFCQNDLVITPKGYRYLSNTAVPTQNIVMFCAQTNASNETHASIPKKREADNSYVCDSNTEPCIKKPCMSSIDSNLDISPNLPGPSRKRDLTDIDSTILVNKKPRLQEYTITPSQITATTHKVLAKREAEEYLDIIPQKKRRTSSMPKTASKRSSLVLAEDDQVIIKKKRKDENVKSPAKKRVSDFNTECHISPKKIRMDTYTPPGSTYSTPRKQKLSAMLRWNENKVKHQKLKIKRLQTQSRRLKRKLVNVQDILKELKEKFAMTNENLASLQNLNVQVQDLIGRQIANVNANIVSKKKYSPALRSFALTLNYYSPKAYEYVRRVFNTSLPHPSTLKKWYSKIGGDPGFTKEAFAALKRKADSSTSPLVATLVIDEMSIRRRIEWDGKKLHGYVDMGTGIDGDHLAEAKEALVFLITAINSNFKVPVGFFLVDGVTGVQRAELVKQCLQMANSAGVKIVALTFDGCAANIAMAGQLGCSIQDFQIKFDHPVTHDPIVAVLDPCHMIKLIRNSFENYQTFVDSEGNQIEWKYLEQLNNLQYTETFHLANKLKDRHINFKNERMKVKLATQLFSLSVAEAIKFCREDLQMESFAFSEPTEKFLVIFNNVFDIFNSKNLHQYGFKKALNKNNANSVFEFLNLAFQYISSLRLIDGTLAIKSLRKTGFLGFLNCIVALKQLYLSLIESNILIYLPFYKLSQDHLELLFCNIRSHGGSNNNPTARQFISAYKKMLVHVELKDTGKGNCIALEQLSILNCSSAEERINRTSGLNIEDDENLVREIEDYSDYDEPDFEFSDFSQQAIVYIAGYIVKKMIKSINCNECVNGLITSKDPILHKFIIVKDKGGLQYPSKDVIQICQVAEKFVRNLDGGNIKKERLTIQILRQFVGSNVFDTISNHQLGEFPTSNHVTDLIKAVIERYLDVRIHHLLKLKLKISKRQLLNKYVLFQGQ